MNQLIEGKDCWASQLQSIRARGTEAWWLELGAEGFRLEPQVESRESDLGLTCGF